MSEQQISPGAGLHNAIAAMVDRARNENRTVFADNEARIILSAFPDAGVSSEKIVTLILDACSTAAGTSVSFGE
jgi:hypothetical protein